MNSYPDEEVDDLYGDRVVDFIELVEEDEDGGLDVHDAIALGVVEEPVEEEREARRGGGGLRLHRGCRALGSGQWAVGTRDPKLQLELKLNSDRATRRCGGGGGGAGAEADTGAQT